MSASPPAHTPQPFERAAPAALRDDRPRANVLRAGHDSGAAGGRCRGDARLAAVPRSGRDIRRARCDGSTRLLGGSERVTEAGGVVHWARDAEEANGIVAGSCAGRGARGGEGQVADDGRARAERRARQRRDRPIETDLAERIIQLAGERPSHLLVPSLHQERSEIAEILRKALDEPGLGDDPTRSSPRPCMHLRAAFLRARVAVSGANFAVAETGSVASSSRRGTGGCARRCPRRS